MPSSVSSNHLVKLEVVLEVWPVRKVHHDLDPSPAKPLARADAHPVAPALVAECAGEATATSREIV